MYEIRWHARGGQGAKTAALMLAEVCFNSGKYAIGFPEYGPERMGAPITAYNKIDDKKIRDHSNVYEPDLSCVLDETLLESVDVAKGLKEGGFLLINAGESFVPKKIEGIKIFTIDASKIAEEEIGKNIPNTSILSALVRISNIIDEKEFLKNMEESFAHKFAKKPEMIDGNMRAVARGYNEIKEY